MLRLRMKSSRANKKTPAAGWQTRERVGDELSSADTLSYENGPCAHAETIAARQPQSILGRHASCDPEGPSGGLVKAGASTDVRSMNAPCRRCALAPGAYRRMFSVGARLLFHQLATSGGQHVSRAKR
jgi:hypothetical protein